MIDQLRESVVETLSSTNTQQELLSQNVRT